MKVSVIVPVYNGEKLIGPLLESLLRQDYPDYEIIVSDDGSTDRTREIVGRYPVRFITGSHGGISMTRNRGIKAARGEIILSIDSDLVIETEVIEPMIAPLQDPGVGVTMAWWEIANPESLVASLIHKTYEYFTRDLVEFNFFWSYCIAFRREIVDEIGDFNPHPYYNYVEDVDLAYRVRRAGYRILFLRDVVVRHHFRSSLRAHLARHWLIARNKLIYVLDNREFFDQRSSPVEYFKLILHTALLASIPFIFFSPVVFLILLPLCLLSHLPMTLWSIRSGRRYLLILPFEFLTKLTWVVGMVCGLAIYLRMKIAGLSAA